MAEHGLDMKVVQYVMGQANVGITMEVYNHITEQARITKELAKNPVKSMVSGTSSNFIKEISTHLLTVLIIGVIVCIEQRGRRCDIC